MSRWSITAVLAGVLLAASSAQGEDAAVDPAAIVRDIPLETPILTYQIGRSAPQRWDLVQNFKGVGDGPFSIGYVPYEDGFAVFGVDLGEEDIVEVCFDLDTDRACFPVSQRNGFDLTFRVGETTYPVRLRAQTPAASFSPAYRKGHQGGITTIAPPFYELYNVAIALTAVAEQNPGSVYTDTDYYRRLRTHFDGHRDHALIRRINTALADNLLTYYILKTDALSHRFDEKGRIVPSSTYFRGGFPGSQVNEIAAYIPDFQNFADDTNFLDFYTANRSVFDDQIAFFQNDIDVNDMLTWLKSRFPDADAYDSVKIVLSPLTGYVQFLLTYEDRGFRELQPHINFPYRPYEDLSPAGDAVARGTLLFTELNHGFIAPAPALLRDIEDSFADLSFWIDPDSDSFTTYGTPLGAFDEYLNWALLSLYAHDRMSKEDWPKYKARIARIMAQSRGFSQFAPFNDQLVSLYLERAEGQTVADLYPAMLAWAKAHKAEQAP